MPRVLPVLLCASWTAAAPATRPVERHGSYVTVNGIRTYYKAHGSGPPLLLFHGATVSIETFDQQVAFFSPRYRVIARSAWVMAVPRTSQIGPSTSIRWRRTPSPSCRPSASVAAI